MKKYYLFAGLVLLAAGPAVAQTKIGSTGAPDPSAMLEVTSGTASNKGLLLPKMTTAQRNTIASPATGLMIYNTTINETQVNTGTPASPTWTAATAATGWTTAGNTGTTPATNFIGTTDNQPLSIRTNNTEKIRVTAAGNVGIGTATPAVKVQIVDTGDVALRVGTSVLGNMSTVALGSGNNPNSAHGITLGLASYGGTNNDVVLHTASTAATPGSIHLAANLPDVTNPDLNQFVLKNTGYVGIGTNTPAAKLHISDTTDVAIRLATSSGNKMSVNFGNSSHGVVRNLANSGGLGNDVALYTSSGPSAATEGTLYLASNPIASDSIPLTQFALKKNGNIGIGTNTPAAKLHVNNGNITISNDGPVSGSAINVISDNGGGLNPDNVSITAYGPANPIFGVSVARGTLAAPQNSQAGDNTGSLYFAPRVNGAFAAISGISSRYLGNGTTNKSSLLFITSDTLAMTIDSNQNVGIGTMSPDYRLHVIGDINASGAVRSNGIVLTSDARLKHNIINTQHGLSTIMALRPVEYEKKNSIQANEYSRHEIGFIAQEIAKVLPSLVTEGKDADKTLAVSYTELIPVLTKAIQEQQSEIEALKAKNEQLEAANKATAQLMERVKQMEQMMGIKEIEGTSKVAGK